MEDTDLPVISDEGLIDLVGAQNREQNSEHHRSGLVGLVWVERPGIVIVSAVDHLASSSSKCYGEKYEYACSNNEEWMVTHRITYT